MIKTNSYAQTGLNFQGVARSSNNVIIASQQISLRLSILQGTATGSVEYSETRKVTTNAQGLFAVVIGDADATSTIGIFNTINWKNTPKYLKIEMDANAGNNYTTIGTTQFQYVAYAQFASSMDAENILGIVPVNKGGTGVSSITALKTALSLDKINNIADADKPISTKTQTALDLKLNAADTSKYTKQSYTDAALLTKFNLADTGKYTKQLYTDSSLVTKLKLTDTASMLSNRIGKDTLNLSARINAKANTSDVNTVLALKANTIDITTSLGLKANASEVTTSLLSKLNKIDTSYLLQKADTATLSNRINLKANVSDLNTSLSLKANASDVTTSLSSKVDKVTGKELSTNDYSNAEKAKLAAITGTNTGDQDLSSYATNTALALKANTVDVNTALALKANASDVATSLSSKVDKISGKELSTNDYTTVEKTKLAAITGVNTGDQDLTSYATNTALSLKANIFDVNTALELKANTSDLTIKENISNKSTSIILGTSDTHYPTQNAVKTYVDNQISSGGVADYGITNIKIANNAVNTIKLADNSVTSAKIVNGTISNVHLNAAAAIDYSKLNLTGSVVASDISNTAAIPFSKLNIVKSDITSLGIPGSDQNTTYAAGNGLTLTGTTFSIGAGAITNTTIADGAVSTAKVADASITSSKISGAISVSNGGTGLTTLTSNSVLVGNGTSTVNLVAPGTSGNVLTSNGTTWASAAPSGGGSVTSLNDLNDAKIQGSSGSYDFTGGVLLGHKNVSNLYYGLNTTAVGIGSIENLNNGHDNTAVGFNSMKLLFQGDLNTAVGSQSLYSVYSGTYNTAVGFKSLYNNTNSQNTAVGYASMLSNTSGSLNTAVGNQALQTNVSGVRNTALGFSSLLSSTGDYNTAAGFSSLSQNTSGYGNSGFGIEALVSNTTGYYNTSIGYQSGIQLISGHNNTLIGYNSQPSSSSVNNEITLGDASVNKIRSGATSITALSDLRDKTDIVNILEGINFVKQLRPVTFTWNTRDKAKVGIKSAGFIAQELLALQKGSSIGINLDLVSEDNPDKLEARYGNLLPVMVKAIQEQQTIIEDQKRRLEVLEKLVNELIKKQ